MRRRKHWPGCKRGRYCTLDHVTTDAAMARRKRWRAGDIIEGDDGYGTIRVRITAIGERCVLGVLVHPIELIACESEWAFDGRCWRKVR